MVPIDLIGPRQLQRHADGHDAHATSASCARQASLYPTRCLLAQKRLLFVLCACAFDIDCFESTGSYPDPPSHSAQATAVRGVSWEVRRCGGGWCAACSAARARCACANRSVPLCACVA
eukprot:5702672-Prymnesium_polylepis.1